MTRSHVTTHVLDAVTGTPAEGVGVTLLVRQDDGWLALASGVTDADGRVTSLGPESLAPGTYQVRFDVGAFFEHAGRDSFYPTVEIAFTLAHADEHYHVPLLLSPFAYSTYRGS